MKQKTYLSLIAIIILVSPLFTITSMAELVSGQGHFQKKVLFAWEIEKTNSRYSWKIKRENKEEV